MNIFNKNKRKGVTPIVAAVLIIIVAVFGFLGYSAFTGQKFVQRFCKANDVTVCQNVEFQSQSDYLFKKDQYKSLGLVPEFEARAGVTGVATGGGAVPTPTPPAETQTLSVKEYSVNVQEPYSMSWSLVNSTYRLYMAGVDLSDPNTAAITTIAVTNGAGSATSWNRAKTETQYKVVLDGLSAGLGFGWYDVLLDPFVFNIKTYNKALGTYTSDFDSTYVQARIGTIGAPVNGTSGAGVSVLTNNVTYNTSSGSGSFTIDYFIRNTGSNNLLKKAVIHFQNDQADALEGNEFTTVTATPISGTNFGIPPDVSKYVINYVPIQLGDIKGGVQGTYRFSYTVSNTNCANNEKLHVYFDDLGGYRGHDVLINNLGVNATDAIIMCNTA